ncbi:MFS transporter, partial [Patescibacteria group bacterium]|nr:MFS transporter [Patescibacteria group bacterium]
MNYPNNKTFYKRNISIFYFVEFFSSLYFLIPIWVAFELRYLSFSQLATIEIIIYASQLILELPTGALADLLGKKPTIFMGMIISGISYIVFGISDSYIDFVISAFLMGLGASLTSGAREALLFDTLKQVGKENTFDKVSSKLNVVFQSGMSAAILAGGFLSLIHFRLPPIAAGISLIISGIFVLFLFEPKIDTEKFTLINYIKQTKKGFMELFNSKYSSLISIFYGLVGGITFSIQVVFT